MLYHLVMSTGLPMFLSCAQNPMITFIPLAIPTSMAALYEFHHGSRTVGSLIGMR